jgi:ElaB/YqjD/DUF883 family membrane-anchored ribosome-binding protein
MPAEDNWAKTQNNQKQDKPGGIDMPDQFGKEGQQGGFGGQATGAATKMKEEFADKAATAKEKVADLGRKAVDAIDRQREPAAGALDRTAAALHQTGDKLGDTAHATGDKVQATADYLRRTDTRAMVEDVQDLVKRYPGQALAAAAVVGFLFARIVRADD